MEVTISTTQKQPAMKRTQLHCSVSFTEKATPSRADLQQFIASKLKSKPELVIIRELANQFGKSEAVFSAYIYDDENALTDFSQPFLKKRNEIKAEVKTEE